MSVAPPGRSLRLRRVVIGVLLIAGISPDRVAGAGVASLAAQPSTRAAGAVPACNADPRFNTLTFTLAARTLGQFEQALRDDPAYRGSLGDVAYLGADPYPRLAFPELLDPGLVTQRLLSTGEFASVGPGDAILCGTPPPDVVADAIEYYNTRLGHYFVTAFVREQQAIEAGAVGADWIRTGESFPVIVEPGCLMGAPGGLHPAYRFTGIPDRGPASHFFTVSTAECAVVRDRADWAWQYEGIPFWAREPVDGGCATGLALHRAYNAGAGGTPNHRYSTKRSIIDDMTARGWVDEGVAMCVAQGD
jgi:serine protease